jgi:hypothetical protein
MNTICMYNRKNDLLWEKIGFHRITKDVMIWRYRR